MHSVLDIIEESTDSAGPDLISLDDLKLALGIEGATEDAALRASITMQSRLIAEYCNRRFGLAEVLETFTFDRDEYLIDRQALTLSLYPVVEIIEVSTAGATAADYDFDPASGRMRMGGCWAETVVAVLYSGGYDLPEQAPARLQQAVIQAVSEGRTTGSRDPSIREVQHGDTRVAYFTPTLSTASSGYLSAVVVDLIKPYRRLHVAYEAIMSLTGVLLGLINIAIVVAILLLVGAIILWLLGWLGMSVPGNVQKGYMAVVALIALYMVVALLLGIPSVRIIGVP